MTQLKPAPSPDKHSFVRPFLSNLSLLFLKGDINKLKSFEIEKFLNKYWVKKRKGQTIEYFVC